MPTTLPDNPVSPENGIDDINWGDPHRFTEIHPEAGLIRGVARLGLRAGFATSRFLFAHGGADLEARDGRCLRFEVFHVRQNLLSENVFSGAGVAAGRGGALATGFAGRGGRSSNRCGLLLTLGPVLMAFPTLFAKVAAVGALLPLGRS